MDGGQKMPRTATPTPKQQQKQRSSSSSSAAGSKTRRRGRAAAERAASSKTSSRKQRRSRARGRTKVVKQTWLRVVVDFFYFILVDCLVMWPLHVVQKWFEDYTIGAQRARTEDRYLNIMNSTDNLETWLTNAAFLDNHRGMQAWKEMGPNESECDADGLMQDHYCARVLALSGNERAMAEFLRSQLYRAAHGLTSPSNFRYYTSTKSYVEKYNDSIVKLIQSFGEPRPYNNLSTTPFSSSDNLKKDPLIETNSPKSSNSTTALVSSPLVINVQCDTTPKHADDVASSRDYSEPRPVPSLYLSSLLNWAAKPHPLSEIRLTDIQKLKVLQDTLRSYGRSALMLSGGSTLGVSHTGVARALFEAGLLPDIISGSSAGSIIASLICCLQDSELRELLGDSILTGQKLELSPFTHKGFSRILKDLLRTGAIMDVRVLMESLRNNVGDVTFEEAYRNTGRILNVCVTSNQYSGTHMDRHMLLNYVTSPNVVVWSAVSASCALPGLFTAVQLIEKLPDGSYRRFLPGELWCDGSVARDLPRESLASLFNVNYFIVSQVNPHIIPFLRKPVSPLVYKQRRPRKILSSLWYGFCLEAHHWILKLFDVGILSKTGRWGLPYLFLTQRYDGDILILPVGNVLHAIPDYFNIVANPSSEYIAFVTSRAQLRTWPHLNQIRHSTMVERALLKEIDVLTRRISENNKAPL